jgi:hypothetical protein
MEVEQLRMVVKYVREVEQLQGPVAIANSALLSRPQKV